MSELNEKLATAREGLRKVTGRTEVNVRDFIQKNYTPYEGDESFWLAQLTRPPSCGTP